MGKVKEIWHSFSKSVPIFFIIFAILLYFLAFVKFGGDEYQYLLYSLASAVLSGGVFAAVVKSLQLLGVFEEALTKIILCKKEWLLSLNVGQLTKLWRDVTVTAVSKGFPTWQIV